MLKHTIKYGEWIIYKQSTHLSEYAYHHDSYDGAPDAGDCRCGFTWTITQAIAEINDYEQEHAEAG